LNTFISGLLSVGYDVLSIDCFLKGEYAAPVKSRREISACYLNYYETYNRTDSALRIQDILTATSFLRKICRKVNLVGFGDAGAWCLLASSVTENLESVTVDLNHFADNSEESWLKHLYIPGIMKVGGLRTAASLNAPRRLLIYNIGSDFDVGWVKDFYKIFSAEDKFLSFDKALDPNTLLSWIIKS
jgi:hypothetical protein